MKIIKVTLASVILIGLMISSAYGTPPFAPLFGYVDVPKVLMNYEKAKKAQEQILQKEQNLQDEMAAKRKQAKSRGASDEDMNNIEKDFDEKRTKSMEYKQKIEHEIKDDVSKAVAAIAINMRIDVVVNKQALIFVTSASVDLTDKVIEMLNKKK